MDIEVKPNKWTTDNRVGFTNDIYKTFNRNNYPNKLKEKCKCSDSECDIDIKTIQLFPHQRILKDFLQFDSPYRGVLAYHELGSGKSAASIAAAEGFVEKRNIYVLTPASLAKNYENELLKISTTGLNMKKSWSQLKIKGMGKSKDLLEKLKQYGISDKFIKKDNIIWIPLYQNDMDKDVEVLKKNISYKSISKEDKQRVDDTIMHIIKNKYTFISYNGLTQKLVTDLNKKTFNNSFVIVDEIHNLISRIVNGSKLARGIYNNLMTSENCKLVLLSGTPIINNPFEIASLLNLVRGPMTIYNFKLLSTSKEADINIIKSTLKNTEYIDYIDYLYYQDRTISIALLPEGYIRENDSYKVKNVLWAFSKNKLLENIEIELNKIKDIKISKKFSEKTYYALPNNKEDFDKLFINSSDEDNPKIKNEDLFQRRILGTISYYRTSGSELFPELLPIKINYLNMTEHQLSIYDEVRAKERAMDESNKFKKGILTEKNSVYRAFSRMVCNFAFPSEIKRLFPQDIRKILKKELDVKEEDANETEEKETDAKNKVQLEYDKMLNDSIKNLVSNNYLTNDNLKDKYSPKYFKMLGDIESSPGSVLIYSQFRSVEGLGIFTKVLDQNNYKEVSIIKTDSGYKFEDISIFNEEYDNKRYILFSSDREKTNQLMHIFNGDFSLVNNTLLNELPDRITKQDKFQLYGKLIKIMMITQSGAEGISLKNVRSVLIMEYFWNSVRINQVIGRAVRTCSHELLPKHERNVQVIGYIMKLTKEQLKKNFTIKNLDKGITTDEHILQIAKSKETLINQFLQLLKSASFDCIINSEQNKPLESGYKCYNWPINIDNKKLSYTKNMEEDYKILKKMKYKTLKKDKGQAISINGKKYVKLNNKFYDYNSYKNAGILIRVDI
jgi:hypothetical protein